MSARVILLLVAALLLVAPGARAQSTFTSNGVAISYVDRGRGAPVVLLHGFTGSWQRHFERSGVMPALEEAGYRVIGVDLRGHGQSGKPLAPAQYGMDFVTDVVRLLDHLSIPKAHIVGYSLGGAIASQLMVKHPQRVITVSLIGAGWEGNNLTTLRAELRAMAEGFDRRDASGLLGAVGAGGLTQADLDAATADLFARNDPAVLANIARGMPAVWELSGEQLQASTAPMLAIVGTLDRNREAVQRMKTVLPRLEIVELQGATHQSSVRPSAPYLVAFLERHPN